MTDIERILAKDGYPVEPSMSELLPTKQWDNKVAVLASDLYRYLGLSEAHFARWADANIAFNQFAAKGEDWILLSICGEQKSGSGGHNKRDFVLTSNFAKKLAMTTQTKRGEIARNYFVKCEEELMKVIEESKLSTVPKDNFEALRLFFNATDEKFNDHEARIKALEDKPVQPIQTISSETHTIYKDRYVSIEEYMYVNQINELPNGNVPIGLGKWLIGYCRRNNISRQRCRSGAYKYPYSVIEEGLKVKPRPKRLVD